jgi:aminopeptidase N
MRLFALWLFVPFLSFAQSEIYETKKDTSQARKLQIDQIKLDVSVSFEPELGRVLGSSKITFKTLDAPLDSIWFDGIGMNYQSVILDGQRVPYRLFRKGIALLPEQPLQAETQHTVRIDYKATPRRGIFFVGWEDKSNRAPKQIWTQGQGIDHRHWIPHVDAQNDKLITSLTVTFDEGYAVISNGKLLDKMNQVGKIKWHYTMEKPHSSYLMMLAIGKYDEFKEQSNTGIALSNYYYPDWKDRNQYTYFQSTPVFDYLADEIGVPYPWQNYKQVPVMNFQHGAMENTGATIFGDFFCVDSISFNDRNYVGVNAHELAHQWFGNLVTATHSKHHWLHEGFATYYAWLAEKEVFGLEHYALLRKQSLDRVLAAEQLDNYPLAHGKAGSSRFYDKGAWVLLMLRKEVGEKAWHKAIKSYLNEYAFDMVQTDDLQRHMETASGKDLDWFFQQWVYRSEIPNLKVAIVEDDDAVNVTVTQELLENQPPDQLTVALKIMTNRGERAGQIKMEGVTANYSFSLKKREKLLAVIPDPEFSLLAIWQMDANSFLLENALADRENLWPFAAALLINHPAYDPKIADRIQGASTPGRVAFAEALGRKTADQSPLADEEISFLNEESSPEVAKAFLKQTAYLQPEILPVVEKWLTWPSYDLVELALLRLCINDRERATTYLAKTAHLEGTSGHNVRITSLLLSAAMVNTSDVVKLVDYMSPAYDFLTRMNAFDAASQLGYANYKVADFAFGTLFQHNRKLRASGRDFIKQMSTKDETRKPFQLWINRNRKLLSIDQLDIIERMTGLKPEE